MMDHTKKGAWLTPRDRIMIKRLEVEHSVNVKVKRVRSKQKPGWHNYMVIAMDHETGRYAEKRPGITELSPSLAKALPEIEAYIKDMGRMWGEKHEQ